jgi:hypothetical protein
MFQYVLVVFMCMCVQVCACASAYLWRLMEEGRGQQQLSRAVQSSPSLCCYSDGALCQIVVTVVSQWCYSGVTVVLQWY